MGGQEADARAEAASPDRTPTTTTTTTTTTTITTISTTTTTTTTITTTITTEMRLHQARGERFEGSLRTMPLRSPVADPSSAGRRAVRERCKYSGAT